VTAVNIEVEKHCTSLVIRQRMNYKQVLYPVVLAVGMLQLCDVLCNQMIFIHSFIHIKLSYTPYVATITNRRCKQTTDGSLTV